MRLLPIAAFLLFAQATPSSDVFVRSARCFDAAAGEMRGPVVVHVHDGRITEVIPAERFKQRPASMVDLGSATLLPGLVDGHVHLQLRGQAEANALTLLRAGFTTVVDLGATTDVVLRLRDRIAARSVEGPRILAAGLWVGTHGGVCEFGGIGITGGADAFRQRVRDNVQAGADLIKVCVSAWTADAVKNPDGYEIRDDNLAAASDEAHRLGKRVVAHAISRGGVGAALRAGVNGFAHAADLDSATSEELRKRSVFVVPTLASLTTNVPAAEAGMLRAGIATAYRAGVTLVFGTDSGALPHGQNAREFAAMTEAGIRPVDAIRSATIVAAKALGLDNDVGTIDAGRNADIIAVDGDPLRDINALSRVVFVMHNGRVITREP